LQNLYNNKMTTIILTDPEQATLAGEWAVKNIGFKHWTLQVENMFTPRPQYHYKFSRKKDAVLFSLKWA